MNTLYVHIQFNITFRDDVIHFDDRLVDLCIKMNYLSCNHSKKKMLPLSLLLYKYMHVTNLLIGYNVEKQVYLLFFV